MAEAPEPTPERLRVAEEQQALRNEAAHQEEPRLEEDDEEAEAAAVEHEDRVRRQHDTLRREIEIEEMEARLFDLRRRRGAGGTPVGRAVSDFDEDDSGSNVGSSASAHAFRSSAAGKPRLKEPEVFRGKTLKEAGEFMQSLELVFALAPESYRGDREKVLYGVMYLAGEPRETWHHNHNLTELGSYSWSDFKRFVLDAVEDPANRTLSVTVAYEEARQKENQSVSAFAAELATLEDQMDPYTPAQRTRHLLAKLRPALRLNIVTHHDPPQRREDLVSLATRLETASKASVSAVPLASHKRIASKTQERSQSKRRRGGSPRRDDGDSHAKREQGASGLPGGQNRDRSRYADWTCYTCGEVGHISTHCTKQAKTSRVSAGLKRAKGARNTSADKAT